jgi:membrane protein DedA with SNARE-associated domain
MMNLLHMHFLFDTVTRVCERMHLLGYVFVFLFSFAESLAIVGSLVPGGTVVIISGFLTVNHCFNLSALIVLASLGAIAGDTVSFFVGTKGAYLFHDDNVWLKRSHLETAESFFKEHGDKSVFLGRFVGIIRPIVPFVAGLSGMSIRKFMVWNVTSGILWAVTHVMLGFFIGRAADSFVGVPKILAFSIVLTPIVIVVLWWRIKRSRSL